MMVTPTNHARLVGNTKAITTVVVPKRFRTDMIAGSTFIPFDIDVCKILPGIMILCLMFV